jgi:polyisoprenoid-binding protein YceI
MEIMTITKWAIDNQHSVAQFKVRHLGVANVTGTFKVFQGELIQEDEEGTSETSGTMGASGASGSSDFDGAKIQFTIDTNSLDTNHAQRDGHLKSPDFFHTEQFPAMTFSGVLRKMGGQDIHDGEADAQYAVVGDQYTVVGDLTIRDVTKAVTFDAELTGTGKGRFGDNRAGFEVDGKINRKDFGLVWSMLTESGGLIVGEEVKVHFDVALLREG